MSCNCGKPKCKGQCGCKSPAVLQINNPSTYVSFHKVTIPASMGDSTTNPPENGKYRNVLVHYDADDTSWLYSSDGIPTKITGPQGPVGPIGPAGTIEIGTTTTGESGSDASVENVGTPENAILNFTIPRGEQGEQGIQGETGPQGYMNEQDVRDVVDTIVPEDFFAGDATDSDCGDSVTLSNMAEGKPKTLQIIGNTTQQTYTGKNLVGLEGITFPYTLNGVTVTREDDGSFTFNGTLSAVTNFSLSPYESEETYNSLLPFDGQTVTLSIERSGTATGLDFRNYGLKQSSGDTFTANLAQSPKTGTLNLNISSAPRTVRLGVRLGGGTFTNWNLKIQLERGSAATSYEKYVGGQASPNPLYPQTVNVVTGNQTITVTGESTASYVVDLGNIELLKLGDYQDYIYKKGDEWILHKETGFTQIDSLNDGLSYAINTSSTNTTRVTIYNCLNQIPIYTPASARTLSKSNRFAYYSNWSTDVQGFFIDSNTDGTKNGIVFRALKSTVGASEVSVEQWLNDNPILAYYVLMNPSETVIDNTALIEQLNAISLESGDNDIVLTSDGLLGSICVGGYTDTKAGIIERAQDESDANADAIDEIEEELEQVHYIFPPNWSGSHGDTSIIKAYGKTIMIDSLAYGSRDDLLAWVKSNNVEHLDYFFLSHYHADHYGGIDPLVGAGIINTDTVVYLPIICNINENWSIISHFHDLFNEKGITYIEPTVDGTTVTISDEFSIELYNLDRDWLDNSGITDGNATSMLCYIKHGDKRILYTGDAAGKILDRPITEGYIEGGLDFYKVEHHGINYSSVTSLPRLLLEKTQPTFSYTPANLHLLYQNNISVSITNSYLKSIGTKMYSSWNSEEQIEFVSTINSFKNLSGRPLSSVSNAFDTPTIYVDMSVTEADGIPDGTQEHPFRDLSQALGYCNRTMTRATIQLADGTYNASHPDLHSKDLPRFMRLNVRIVGNTEDRTAVKIMNGVIAEDSIVDFDSVTVVASDIEGCRLLRSRSVINNCLFMSELETVGAGTNAIYSEHSDIVIRGNTKFQHLNLGVSTHDDTIRLSSCEFDDIDQTAIYLRNTSAYVGNCTFSSTVNARFSVGAHSNLQMDPVLLYNGSTTSSVITLNDDITKYNKLLVSSGVISGGTFYTDEIRTYSSEMFGLGKTYKCYSDSGKVTLVVDASDPTKVTVTAPDSLRTIYAVREQR